MRTVGIVIILAIAARCQVSPIWAYNRYVQTSDITIINTDFTQSGVFNQTVTYATVWINAPTVILCTS